jgi:antitoxin (DNA-binding transcriptional repressor) of toxin-antitoxin stability system
VKRDDKVLIVDLLQFKANCLRLMEQVHQRKGSSILVTKQGKPYVRILPFAAKSRSLYGCLAGMVEISGDLTQPTGEDWEALRD